MGIKYINNNLRYYKYDNNNNYIYNILYNRDFTYIYTEYNIIYDSFY